MAQIKISVVLILVSAIKCLSMSDNELEDFENFLKKTSQLSPTLKKGVDPDDDFDDDELMSDHAWEISGKFEGDLVLNEKQRRLILEHVAEGLSRNGIRDGTKRWPNNEVIYFIQREHFNSDQVQAIESGIDDLARASCVTFRPYKKGDRNAVVIQGSRRGCFSQVGYQGGYQVLNLSGRHPVGRGCFRHGTVVHELLHTLGFYHMQSSSDRDDYVKVVWENIIESARHNFRKYNLFTVSDFGVGYDYESVLHYSRRAFSVNGKDTIVPKKRGAQIGQRIGLSDKDTQKLNKMYCDANSNEGTNQQADDGVVEKAEDEKKILKSKPFDGHGIGYHQGKGVIIKLLPAPETYQLTDVPNFHIFDYFSKTPETLPTPEIQEIRMAKDIAYFMDQPHQLTTEIQTKPVIYTNSENESSKNEFAFPVITDDRFHNNFTETKQPDSEIFNTESEKQTSLGTDEILNNDLVNTFDRLTKIIKQHVYPSQAKSLNIYKANKGYDLNLSENGQEYKESPVKGDEKLHEAYNKMTVQYIENSYDKPIVRKRYPNNVKTSNKRTNEIEEQYSKTSHTPPILKKINFESIEPKYNLIPIFKNLPNADYSDTLDYETPPKHHYTNREFYGNTYMPRNTNQQFNDERKKYGDKWYADINSRYDPFLKYRDSDSEVLLQVRSNTRSSERDNWPMKGNRDPYRYSSFYGIAPDYLSSIKHDDWYGIGRVRGTQHERHR